MAKEHDEYSARIQSPEGLVACLQKVADLNTAIEPRSGDRFDVRVSGLRTGPVSIVQFSTRSPFELREVGNRESIDLWLVLRGGVISNTPHKKRGVIHGSLILCNGRSPLDIFVESGSDLVVFCISRKKILLDAAEFIERDIIIDFDSVIGKDIELKRLEPLKAISLCFYRAVELNKKSLISSYVVGKTEEAFIAYLIDYFDGPKSLDEPVIGTLPASVRRALETVGRLAEPMTVHQLAGSVGLTTRALQNAFIKSLGETPHVILKRARVSKLRDEMLANPEKRIEDVGQYWGFTNHSRLKEIYISIYGEDDWKINILG